MRFQAAPSPRLHSPQPPPCSPGANAPWPWRRSGPSDRTGMHGWGLPRSARSARHSSCPPHPAPPGKPASGLKVRAGPAGVWKWSPQPAGLPPPAHLGSPEAAFGEQGVHRTGLLPGCHAWVLAPTLRLPLGDEVTSLPLGLSQVEDPSSPDCVCVSEAPSLEGSPREHSQYT